MSTMRRIQRLREKMREQGLDAMFVSSPENRAYFSGFRGSAGYLWITDKHLMLATDFRYTEQAGMQAHDFTVTRIAGSLDWLKNLVGDSGARRIGIEDAHMAVSTFNAFKKQLDGLAPQPEFAYTGSMCDQLRAVKDADELYLMAKAISQADVAMDAVSQKIRPGMTEREVAWMMEVAMREAGADAISFETIIAAGPNGAKPHHHPTDKRIEVGEGIVIDMGAKFDGYCSDITRTYLLGRADEKFRTVWNTVLAAQEIAEATARTGMTGAEVDGLARDVIAKAGYGDTFGHSLGHGIGLAVHEYPRVGPGATQQIIEDGMVYSVEPGIYLTGWGGVRIEDLVVMENGKPRVLTAARKHDLIEL
ncbi:MAG: aminopeptidase P family protein [SAR202 cluster bacterium]|nr:aminopeptidase P family protein [SAR202 cluster bacterium]